MDPLPNELHEPPPEVEALHPLVIFLGGALAPPDEGEECLTVEPSVLVEIRTAMLGLAGDLSLRKCAQDLMSLAYFLSANQRSPTVAQAILELLNDSEIVEAMIGLPPAEAPTDEQVAWAAAQFNEFSDGEAKRAPMVNEAPAEGSIKIDKLNFPKRV